MSNVCVSDQGYSASLPVPVLGQVLSEHAVLACTVSSWPVMLTSLCSCLVTHGSKLDLVIFPVE